MTCKHDLIQTFRLETGEPVMWACVECRAKFVPMRQLMDEVAAEREARLMAENEALRADRDNLQIEVLNLKGDRAELVEALLYVNERSSRESVKKDEFERRIADALVKWEASNAAAIRSRT